MSLAYNDDFKYFSNLSLMNSIFSFKKSKRIEKCDYQQIFDDVQERISNKYQTANPDFQPLYVVQNELNP